MGKFSSVGFLATAVIPLSSLALAQNFNPPQTDPCVPRAGFLGGYVPPSAQQQQACLAERKAQWDAYGARQQEIDQQRRVAEAAHQAAELEAQRAQEARARLEAAEQVAAARRRERQDLIGRQQAYAQLIAAENSLDNQCKAPDTARALIETWNGFDAMKENNVKVIDIEHLTTTEFDATNMTMNCHGVFVTTSGVRISGGLSTRKNVAGDPISTWKPDVPQNLAVYDEPPSLPADQDAPVLRLAADQTGATNTAEVGGSFDQGLSDRKAWEAWISALPDDEAKGAQWWAANRSIKGHADCSSLGSGDNAPFAAGCLNARQRLTPIDLRRRADPEYKKGWNSL